MTGLMVLIGRVLTFCVRLSLALAMLFSVNDTKRGIWKQKLAVKTMPSEKIR